MMKEDLKLALLHNAFETDSSWINKDEDVIMEFSKLLGQKVEMTGSPMKFIVDQVYEQDSVESLLYLIEIWEDSIFDMFLVDSEGGDWFDDNEDHNALEAEYGDEGYDYYEIHTKNKIHDFECCKPFGGVEYTGTRNRS
jgi:hypothetical protein